MIPIIWGWIMRGTQSRTHSIEEALDDKMSPITRVDKTGLLTEREVQYGSRSRSGLVPRPSLLELQRRSISITQAESKNVNYGDTELSMEQYDIRRAGSTRTTAVLARMSTNGISNTEGNRKDSDTTAVEHLSQVAAIAKTPLCAFPSEDYDLLKIPTWLGLGIEGDEALSGPIFNYARLFTFREFSSTITSAFRAALVRHQCGCYGGE